MKVYFIKGFISYEHKDVPHTHFSFIGDVLIVDNSAHGINSAMNACVLNNIPLRNGQHYDTIHFEFISQL